MWQLLKRLLAWLDTHALLLLAGFLLIFIPTYPKLPLFEAIPGYIVRVRFEDLLMLIASLWWFIQVVRRKITWPTSALGWIGAYALGGLLSLLSAILLIQTIPAETLHVAKSTLHYFRYLEYFALLAIVYSALKTKQQVAWLVGVVIITLLGISLYGYGQKYYYWPVYSTMNREFSKGMRLYLTEHARVQSTFGGHYDLSAYLVIVLPLALALALRVKSKSLSLALHAVHAFGVWTMVVAASRTSFLGYLMAAELVIILLAIQQITWVKKLHYGLVHSAGLGILVGVLMFFYGESIYERFLQVLDGYPEYRQLYHDANKKRKELFDGALVAVGLKSQPTPPPNSLSLDELESRVLANSDERPSPDRPSDVYADIPDKVRMATMSADGTYGFITVEKPRTYSDNALKYGLSLAIRLDTLWPRAIAGFLQNPIFGSGYATLTKETVGQFTEAESTDNNFLRTLGETGLFGFIAFYGLVAMVMRKAYQRLFATDVLLQALALGVFAGSIGLLINAAYIDVFAASKVAFTYWGMVGLFLAADALIPVAPSRSHHIQPALPKTLPKRTHAKTHHRV